VSSISDVPGPQPEQFLRLPAVKALVGLSTSTIYKHVSSRSFPRRTGCLPVDPWHESCLRSWLGRLAGPRLGLSHRPRSPAHRIARSPAHHQHPDRNKAGPVFASAGLLRGLMRTSTKCHVRTALSSRAEARFAARFRRSRRMRLLRKVQRFQRVSCVAPEANCEHSMAPVNRKTSCHLTRSKPLIRNDYLLRLQLAITEHLR
jgi:predicted DNA-binding transcriptional regulator AlpA